MTTARRGAILASLVIAALHTDGALAAGGPTFATPEAAVRHFVTRLAADDLDGALRAFHIDEILARADAARKVRPKKRPASASSSTLASMAKINVMAEFAGQTRGFVYGLLLDGEDDLLPIEATDANIDRFIRAVDPARLRAVRIVRIDQPVPSIMKSEQSVDLAKKRAAKEGADDSTERIALFQLDGKHFQGGFTLLRYGKTWRISELQSIYGGGGVGDRPVKKTTPEEYEALTK